MRKKWFKSRVVQAMAALVLLFVALVGYAAMAHHRAYARAEAVSLTVPVGTPVEAARQVIEAVETEDLLRVASDDHLAVGFRGLFLDRWFCNLKIARGRVVSQDVHLLD